MWDIIETCRLGRQKLNDWANYFKHKGGLGFIDLKPESPYAVFVQGESGKMEARTNEFEAITIDMDESIEEVVNAHNALINCMNSLIDFIGFKNAMYSISEDGRFVIPEKSSYCKISV